MADSAYPAALDDYTPTYPADQVLPWKAITAIQTELGVDPAGGSATVAARVAAVESDVAAIEVIQGDMEAFTQATFVDDVATTGTYGDDDDAIVAAINAILAVLIDAGFMAAA